MCVMAKSWSEKLHNSKSPEIAPSVRIVDGRPVGTAMLIPTPSQVKEYIEQIPKGQTRSMKALRADLAAANGAEITCPLCAGIFVRIVAEAALEESRNGKSLESVTPFWRVLEPDSPAAKKIPDGTKLISELRAAEAIA